MALKSANQDEATPDTQELARIDGGREVATANQNMEIGGVYGDLDDIPVRPPMLGLSYAQGKLSEFPKGSFVLGDTDMLVKAGQPLTITVLAFAVYWKEYLKYDPNSQNPPRRFLKKEEVIEAGGTIGWTKREGGLPDLAPTFKMAMVANVLVRKPDDVMCEQFGLELGGKMWAAARWSIDKQAAASVLPILNNDRKLALAATGIQSGVYELKSAAQQSSGGITYFVPKVRLVTRHPEAVLTKINEMLGGNAGKLDINGDEEANG